MKALMVPLVKAEHLTRIASAPATPNCHAPLAVAEVAVEVLPMTRPRMEFQTTAPVASAVPTSN